MSAGQVNQLPRETMKPLERLRKAAGLTLPELGGKVGVTGRQVWNWENGRSEPHPNVYPRLAEVLGVTPMEVTELFCPSVPA
jgi:transcriptional regulator with XRE-family HTH domain